jgi:ABC-2 type transport system permease protein
MRAIYLMARREYLSYVATWGFWLSLLSVPLFMGVGILIPILAETSQPTRYFTVLDNTGQGFDRIIEESVDRDRFIPVDAPAGDIDGLRPYLLGEQTIEANGETHALFAAIIFQVDDKADTVIEYWSTNLTTGTLREAAEDTLQDWLRSARLEELGIPQETLEEINAIDPRARSLNPEREGETAEIGFADRVPIIVGIGFAIGLWIIIFSVTNMLLTAMIEEKGNKILDTLLATARFHEILIGKLAGLAAVSATLLLAWGTMGSGGAFAVQAILSAGNDTLVQILNAVFDPGLIFPALGYFIVGYLMFGTVYLAIGSLCDTLQEAQSLMSPIMLVMMIPFFIIFVTIENPDSLLLQYASWVPFWTPFLMMARLQTDPATLEIIATTVAMLVTAGAIIFLASLVFRQGALGRANASSVKKLFSRNKAAAS